MLCGATSMIDWPERSGAAKDFCCRRSAAASGIDTSKVEPAPGCALQRDAAAHALDDAVGDAQAQARCRHSCGRCVSSACSNSRKIRSLRLGRDADAGVAHQEADFIGPDAGLDDQRDAAGRGELDGVAGEIEQHLPQPRRVADHFHRQPLVDIGRDLDLLGLRARRQQFGDVLDQRGQRERAMFEIDLAGLDLGIIQQFLDQRRAARRRRSSPPWHRSSAPASAAYPATGRSCR